MARIVDCSAIVEMLRTSRGRAVADELRGHALHAPQLLIAEMLHAVRSMLLRGDLSADEAERLLDRFRRLPIRYFPMEQLISAGWALRDNVSAYDAMYIALSASADSPVVTCDARLHRASPEHTLLVT